MCLASRALLIFPQRRILKYFEELFSAVHRLGLAILSSQQVSPLSLIRGLSLIRCFESGGTRHDVNDLTTDHRHQYALSFSLLLIVQATQPRTNRKGVIVLDEAL